MISAMDSRIGHTWTLHMNQKLGAISISFRGSECATSHAQILRTVGSVIKDVPVRNGSAPNKHEKMADKAVKNTVNIASSKMPGPSNLSKKKVQKKVWTIDMGPANSRSLISFTFSLSGHICCASPGGQW